MCDGSVEMARGGVRVGVREMRCVWCDAEVSVRVCVLEATPEFQHRRLFICEKCGKPLGFDLNGGYIRIVKSSEFPFRELVFCDCKRPRVQRQTTLSDF